MQQCSVFPAVCPGFATSFWNSCKTLQIAIPVPSCSKICFLPWRFLLRSKSNMGFLFKKIKSVSGVHVSYHLLQQSRRFRCKTIQLLRWDWAGFEVRSRVDIKPWSICHTFICNCFRNNSQINNPINPSSVIRLTFLPNPAPWCKTWSYFKTLLLPQTLSKRPSLLELSLMGTRRVYMGLRGEITLMPSWHLLK